MWLICVDEVLSPPQARVRRAVGFYCELASLEPTWNLVGEARGACWENRREAIIGFGRDVRLSVWKSTFMNMKTTA